MRVVLVGVCGSGKTTLARALRERGYEVRECHQEHSEAPRMWQVISQPDVLIYLDASDRVIGERGTTHSLPNYTDEERRRLAHARAHADLYLMTDDLSADAVLARTLEFLCRWSRNRP